MYLEPSKGKNLPSIYILADSIKTEDFTKSERTKKKRYKRTSAENGLSRAFV